MTILSVLDARDDKEKGVAKGFRKMGALKTCSSHQD
jgi:hypothetical protein